MDDLIFKCKYFTAEGFQLKDDMVGEVDCGNGPFLAATCQALTNGNINVGIRNKIASYQNKDNKALLSTAACIFVDKLNGYYNPNDCIYHINEDLILEDALAVHVLDVYNTGNFPKNKILLSRKLRDFGYINEAKTVLLSL